ncbi:hypothetical protein GCM10007205_14920 [Oxalicibacterium flavum]|uniref:EF-hand domain-containing protein n=1 Tax=Oxalicibacterium flavum TaxID=179467 RepID=A0A8J2UPP0_9BURK|nr:EF-hand domain-containing protein [Oxalicibacterium flavum]GGC06697.1 hypothetical protein GCM10007205_14920 [Oxalicibacterium flavum]
MNAKYLLTAAALLFTNLALAQSIATQSIAAQSFATRAVITADLQKHTATHASKQDARLQAKHQPARVMHVSNPVQSITKAEARAARIAVIVDNFERIDANGDGVVTREEMRAYLLTNRRHVPMT